MDTKKNLGNRAIQRVGKLAGLACALLVIIGVQLGLVTPALAQLGTTGSITGVVKDKAGERLAGVTVVATSPALQGTQAELTDDTGQYTLTNLPPGIYLVTFYYSEIVLERKGIDVGLNRTSTLNQTIDTGATGGETIEIDVKVGSIDTTSTKQSIVVDKDYIKNVPLPGRTFEGALSVVAGSSGDGAGISFSGSTSLENSYVIDGINTTGISFGNVGSPILNNFIQEQEVITGGYDAEFGRSTGGVVNVVTKSGSNEFHGTVWSNFEPGFLRVDPDAVFNAASAIAVEQIPRYDIDFGFDLGGPIIKDKLWFYVGFAPVLSRTKVIRKLGTRVDREDNLHNYAEDADGDDNPMTSNNPGCELDQSCESDQVADLDPETGFLRFEEVDRSDFDNAFVSYNVLAKLNFAVNPDHQGALSFWGLPGSGDSIGIYGTPESGARSSTQWSMDLSAKWTSKFRNNKSQLDAVVGYHNEYFHQKPRFDSPYDPETGIVCDPSDDSVAGRNACSETAPRTLYAFEPSSEWVDLGIAGRNPWHRESDTTLQHCTDGGSGDPTIADAFPFIENCPLEGLGYRWGGTGYYQNADETRFSGKITWTERVRLAGHHEFKVGMDSEVNSGKINTFFSGGKQYQGIGAWLVQRFVRVQTDPDAPMEDFPNTCGFDDMDNDGTPETPVPCRHLDVLSATGNTLNLGGFLQDKWQILPHFTVKAGIRWEQQYIRNAEQIQGTIDPITGDDLGTNAIVMRNMLAPRIGVLYDFTKEGRSKLYANFGRFYESIPMQMNTRAFGGETQYQQFWDYNTECQANPIVGSDGVPVTPSNPDDCPNDPTVANQGIYGGQVTGGSTVVAPGVKPQYLDEILVGGEYEVLEDLNVGVSYQNRRLGRVVEDVSVDGAATYIIANPGEFPEGEAEELRDDIAAAMDAGDMDRAAKLQGRLTQFEKIRGFDKPRREYNAVVVTAKKRYSKNFFVQGSYAWSRLEGNYPGLFSADNGQVDPNISSQYDLVELLTNRNGRLPNDRPHVAKLDGYYNFDLKAAGLVTAGVRMRIQSGTPVDALGRHYDYGTGESFLLPRGAFGRTDFITSSDLHVAYGRQLKKDMKLEVFFDLFNVFNLQTDFSVDEDYTFDAANPIVGGTKSDLPYLKEVDLNAGTETPNSVSKNLNFGNTTSRFAPLSARVGFNLSF